MKEKELMEVTRVYIDSQNGRTVIGDMHSLIVAIDRLLPKFKPERERMVVIICTEEVHKFEKEGQ
jgi:hypothetical protein